MSLGNEPALEKLTKSETAYKEYYISLKSDPNPVHWISIGCENRKEKNILVFIHGSPGSWVNYLRYLKDMDLKQEYCMFGLDRPGFGKSKGPIADIDGQAEKIWNSLEQIFEPKKNARRLVLMGHSYGGPIAARISSLHSEKINYLVLLAAALDPETEKVRWYNKLAATKLAGWILPEEWKNSNAEMLPLKGQLQVLVPVWKNISAKTIVVQGEEDELVHPDNLEFVKREFKTESVKQTISLPNEGHFLPWKNYDLIKKILLDISKE